MFVQNCGESSRAGSDSAREKTVENPLHRKENEEPYDYHYYSQSEIIVPPLDSFCFFFVHNYSN